jgi:hypothetical protein
MRAKEFVSENLIHTVQNRIRPDTLNAMPNMTKFDDADNSSPYNGWRFGIALAGAPEHKMPAHGATGQKMVVAPYSPEEDAVIDAAARMIGIKPSTISTAGSHEMDDTHKQSPVSKSKKNRYGV